MFITIVDIENYLGIESLKIGQELILVKDINNNYDDEAIKVLTTNNATCGYVSNSTDTVARGTHSAGYIYNEIENNQKCIISFITNDCVIAKID